MAEKPTFAHTHDTRFLIDFLRASADGERETVTYEKINAALGRDVQRDARGSLLSAIKYLQREERLVFWTIRNVGVRLLEDPEVVSTAEVGLQRIRREAARTGRRVAAVRDFDSLPSEFKVKHNAALSYTAAILFFSKAKQLKRLESKIADAGTLLPVARTLDAFKE